MNHRSTDKILMHKLTTSNSLLLGKIFLVLAMLAPGAARASVSGEGDVTPYVALEDGAGDPILDFEGQPVLVPELPDGGGLLAEGEETLVLLPLVIGGTGEHVGDTDFGLVSINNPLFTNPLVTAKVTLGFLEIGAGQLKVSGFGSELRIRGDDLVVGDAGRGTLEINGGGIVRTASILSGGSPTGSPGDTMIGDDFSSRGNLVSVSGFGSLLETQELTVANHGSGSIEVTNQGVLRTDTAIIGAGRNGSGLVHISGDGSTWVNADDLEIGTASGTGTSRNGIGVLEIGTGASVTVGSASSTTLTSGDTDVNELGTVDLLGGTLVTYDLNNSGLIRGYGHIQAVSDFDINSSGALRNATTSTGERERLYIDNSNLTVTNNGTIESVGGEMTFEPEVRNESIIFARDAILRFEDGLDNEVGGSLTLGGETTIAGDIQNSGGLIYVLAGSSATLTGDLVLASGSLSLIAGPNAGALSVQGTVDLSGAELELDYSSGVFANEGDTYELLSSTSEIDTIFTNVDDEVADGNGRIWDIIYNTSSVWVTATNRSLGGDFDSDGDVDGSDFLTWQRGFGTTTDASDLADWEASYGSGSAVVVAVNAVPEPSTLALVVLSLGCFVTRRRA